MSSPTQIDGPSSPESGEGSAGDRDELLQRPQQLAPHDPAARPHVRGELLIEFVKALIRETVNGDAIYLALMRAKELSGATDAEVEILTRALRQEHSERHGPRGFGVAF